MKNKMRDAMNAVLAEACNALPGANNLLTGSKTRAATALQGILAAHIEKKHKKDDDAVAMASALIEHQDFPAALTKTENIFLEVIKDHKQGITKEVVGITISAYPGGISLSGLCGSYNLSYSTDKLQDNWDKCTACPERVQDIIALIRDEMAVIMPGVDLSSIREGVDPKGRQAILHPGWDEKCIFGEHAFVIDNARDAHGVLSNIREWVQYRLKDYAKRREDALSLLKQKDMIRNTVAKAITVLAPDLPLNIIDVEIRSRWNGAEMFLIFEGTGFDLRPGRIESKMKSNKDLDHYVRHNLPGIIAAQRKLRERMDGNDQANVLIEEPFARLLMQKYGDAWMDKVADIMSKRGGSSDKDEGWKAKMTQGVLRGTFKINDKAYWRCGSLNVRTALPEVVIMQLPGRLISEIVEHPYFGPNARIVSASNKDSYQRFPDGTYGFAFSHVTMLTDVPSLRIGDFQKMAKAA